MAESYQPRDKDKSIKLRQRDIESLDKYITKENGFKSASQFMYDAVVKELEKVKKEYNK